MAGVVDVASVGYVAPVVNQKAPVLTLEACYNVQELKRGRYSVISHGDCDVVGAPVVIKTYDRPSLVPKKQKMATREAIVLKYLKSQGVPNITHVWSAYASQDRFHIIMEYCQGGDLLQRLKAAAAPMPEQQLAATIAGPLLRTLAAMHAVGVTHRDIKLENIFLDSQGHPKLGDFDLAVFHHEAPARAPVGTIFYMAPEVLLLAGYKGSPLEGVMQCRVSEKMDVWSLGVCLFELAAGYKPFQGVSYEGIASAVLQHAMSDLPAHISPACRSFMSAALTYDPTQRPSAMQLLDHPWIQLHCPSALRSDSAGSLTNISSSSSKNAKQQQQHPQQQHKSTSNSKTSAAKQQQYQGSSPQQPWQQQQQASSAGGCSSGICEPLTPSSCSSTSITGGSSGSSSSSMLKCSRDMHYGAGSVGTPAAAVASAGGGVALQHAAWQPHQMYYDAGVQQQQQYPALMPMAAHTALPGIRVRSSLGTAHDWSTQDSSIACSPHSMLQRMGFSSGSGTLARQLMPWASEQSSALGLGYNYNVTNNITSNITNQSNPYGSGNVGLHSSTFGGNAGCGVQQQQDLGKRVGGSSSGSSMLSPTDADGRPPAPAATNRHMRSSSASSSSSTGVINTPVAAAAPQQQQQQQVASNSGSRSSGSSSSRTPNQVPAPAEAAANSAAATAAAAGSQHLSPLALAVAAAVAEHNKRQPRMWTPFALRVHQMRVAQVLLAERQRQVAMNQPTPPPPAQPLVPQQGEPVRLPDQDAAAAAAAGGGEQQQQQQQQVGASQREDPVVFDQQQQAAPAAVAAVQDPGDQVNEPQQQQQQQGPALRASSPAGADAAMVRPLVHQMQQQLSMAGQTAASSSSGAGRNSSTSSSQKPPKQPKKKGFLSCFVPRAFE